MADWVLILVDVSLIVAGFLWGERLIKAFLREHKYRGELADFLGFVFLIVLISLLHEPAARIILGLNRDLAILSSIALFVTAYFKYRRDYIR